MSAVIVKGLSCSTHEGANEFHVFFACAGHARKPRQPAAANQMHEHRLRLIICMMGKGNRLMRPSAAQPHANRRSVFSRAAACAFILVSSI